MFFTSPWDDWNPSRRPWWQTGDEGKRKPLALNMPPKKPAAQVRRDPPRDPKFEEYLEIVRWRLEVLEKAGYSFPSATLMADRHDIDLRQAEKLLADGCDEATALEILL